MAQSVNPPPRPPLPAPEVSGEASNYGQRDTERVMDRLPAREYYRAMAPSRLRSPSQPHEKYHIDPKAFPEGCRVEWVPDKVNGWPTGQVGIYEGNGWIPARACDFPEKSGYGEEHHPSILRGGYVKNVQADDCIEIDDQILFVRPEELCRRADQELKRAAQEQIETQAQRLNQAYRPTATSRGSGGFTHGRQYVSSDVLEGQRGREI